MKEGLIENEEVIKDNGFLQFGMILKEQWHINVVYQC